LGLQTKRVTENVCRKQMDRKREERKKAVYHGDTKRGETEARIAFIIRGNTNFG